MEGICIQSAKLINPYSKSLKHGNATTYDFGCRKIVTEPDIGLYGLKEALLKKKAMAISIVLLAKR